MWRDRHRRAARYVARARWKQDAFACFEAALALAGPEVCVTRFDAAILRGIQQGLRRAGVPGGEPSI